MTQMLIVYDREFKIKIKIGEDLEKMMDNMCKQVENFNRRYLKKN